MKFYKFPKLFISILVCLNPAVVFADAASTRMQMFNGYFAMAGNDGTPSKINKHNIYIKFHKGQWVTTLFIPLPYASSVQPEEIDKAFENAKSRTTSPAYIRSDFGQFDEPAIAQIETIAYLEDQLTYECGSLAPCSIKFNDGYLEQIKPGMLNDHIIKFDHIKLP